MKHQLLLVLLVFLWPVSHEALSQEKIVAPLTEDGAWSMNSQPSAVYHNGTSYFAWVNGNKSLVAAALNHDTGDYQETVVASNFRGDFAAPALLVRDSGQILLFASKNEGESHYEIWVTTNPEDISEWSSSKTGIAYGAGGTLPFAVGDDIYVLYRGKNSVGVTYGVGVNADSGPTINADLSSGSRRTGLISVKNGNDYTVKMDIPYMAACQGSDGAIHIVFTQLANGGSDGKYYGYDKSTIHYMKLVGTSTSSSGIDFDLFKADGTAIVRQDIDPGHPADVIYSEEITGKKAWAYDIQLDEQGQPVILFDTFNADGTEHTYQQASWNTTNQEWNTSIIATAGDGLHTTAYTAWHSKFPEHAYSGGGITFASQDLSTVYLSKRSQNGVFDIYKYSTNDSGVTWQEDEALTAGTDQNDISIRPRRIENSPVNAQLDVVWMQGAYTSPIDYDTKIMTRGDVVTPTSLSFENEEYNMVIGDIESVSVNFAPIFVEDKGFTLESSNGNIVRITADNKIEGISIGSATIIAKANSDPSITATAQVGVHEKLVFDVFMDRIVKDIQKEQTHTIAELDLEVSSYLGQLEADGSFPDVDYSSTARTNWPPLIHLDRILNMALAYTTAESSYYEDADLKAHMDTMLQFWQDTQPRSNNWYANEIGEPQRMGKFLILMEHLGDERLSEELMDLSVGRLRDNGGSPSAQQGANRVDVALHYMYRACLTRDYDLLSEAMDFIYSPIQLTEGSEGIQPDYSYTQHGRQLNTGSYGQAFLEGITKSAMYAVGTDYAVPENQLRILSNFVKDSYTNIFRGEYILFTNIGRAATRPNATKQKSHISIFERMKTLDAAHGQVYENAIVRLTGDEPAGFGVTPWSNHYYRSDYTLHNQPKYSVDLRMVSTRTVRNEYLSDNGEGIQQYFMSDGATGIFVDGDEYDNIFPVWNWSKIPGVTVPEFSTVPQATSYIRYGESSFAGGVTDSLNTVSVYQYKDTYSGINTSANKSWFFFDDEIVCLGSNILSTSGVQVNTTLNQTLLDGPITVSSNGSRSTVSMGDYNYENNVDWIHHGKVAYFFPEEGNVDLSAQQRTGDWAAINTNYPDVPPVTEDVFTLSINHGVDPTEESYAYVIVPGVSETEAQTYDISNIEVLVNSDSIQAVYHKEQKAYGLVFHKAASFSNNGVAVESDAGSVVMIKNADQEEVIVHVADPKNGTVPINLGIKTPGLNEPKLITYQASSPHLGKSMKFVVNQMAPEYPGKEVFLDRSDWIIITSIDGPSDAVMGGDEPEYIIDGDEMTAFLFVKPGKSFGGITAAADYEPSFTIDMQTVQDFQSFTYRHRTDNSNSFLRASSVSFYGSNSEEGPFLPIVEDETIATDVPEVKISFDEVSYRYVKLVITGWNTVSGSTIQVAEFNLGTLDSSTLSLSEHEMDYKGTGFSVAVSPSPITSGNLLEVRLSRPIDSPVFEVYDMMGRNRYSSNGGTINTRGLASGLYVLKVYDRNSGVQSTVKFLVK